MQFAYVAFDEGGRLERGLVEALDAREAEGWVADHHFGFVSVRPMRPSFVTLNLSVHDTITPVDVAFFFQQVAAMLRVGVSIHRALLTQAETIKRKRFRQIIQDLADRVARGQRVSEGLALYPKQFPPIVTRLLRGAEEVGRLEMGFAEAGEFVLSGFLLMKKILSAMYYPIAAMLLVVAASYFMVFKVFPVLGKMYSAFDVKLPGLTQWMIAFTHVSVQWGPDIGGAVGLLVVAAVLLLRRPAGRLLVDRLKLKLPVVGVIFRLGSVTRFLRTLRLALMAALPLEEGLELAAAATDNRHFVQELGVVVPRIVAGQGIAEPLKETGLFPSLVIQGLQIGEETGTVDQSIHNLLAYYDDELTSKIKGLTEAINPILTGVAAIGVGFLMAATLLPMYSIYGQLKLP